MDKKTFRLHHASAIIISVVFLFLMCACGNISIDGNESGNVTQGITVVSEEHIGGSIKKETYTLSEEDSERLLTAIDLDNLGFSNDILKSEPERSYAVILYDDECLSIDRNVDDNSLCYMFYYKSGTITGAYISPDIVELIDNMVSRSGEKETAATYEKEDLDKLLHPYQVVLDRINDEYGYGLYIPEAEKESVYEAYKDMTPEEFEAEILKELEEDAKGSGRILNKAALLLDSDAEGSDKPNEEIVRFINEYDPGIIDEAFIYINTGTASGTVGNVTKKGSSEPLTLASMIFNNGIVYTETERDYLSKDYSFYITFTDHETSGSFTVFVFDDETIKYGGVFLEASSPLDFTEVNSLISNALTTDRIDPVDGTDYSKIAVDDEAVRNGFSGAREATEQDILDSETQPEKGGFTKN